jgi:hypothetical protein
MESEMDLTGLEEVRMIRITVRRLAAELQHLEQGLLGKTPKVDGEHGTESTFGIRLSGIHREIGILNDRLACAEAWIGAIDDDEVKSIVVLRCIYGHTWHEISRILYPNEIRRESYPRQKVAAWVKAQT